jgi:hypothetical protein
MGAGRSALRTDRFQGRRSRLATTPCGNRQGSPCDTAPHGDAGTSSCRVCRPRQPIRIASRCGGRSHTNSVAGLARLAIDLVLSRRCVAVERSISCGHRSRSRLRLAAFSKLDKFTTHRGVALVDACNRTLFVTEAVPQARRWSGQALRHAELNKIYSPQNHQDCPVPAQRQSRTKGRGVRGLFSELPAHCATRTRAPTRRPSDSTGVPCDQAENFPRRCLQRSFFAI